MPHGGIFRSAPTTLGDGDQLPQPLVNAAGRMLVDAGGGTSSALAAGQVTLGTTATLIAAARAGRTKITITSTAATVFYVGGSGVTAANGFYVAAAAGASVTLDTAAAVYGVVAAGTLLVAFIETY